MSETREEWHPEGRWEVRDGLWFSVKGTNGPLYNGVWIRDYLNALEQERDELRAILGKYVVAMHSLQHANDVNWETCEKGMCPKVRSLIQEGK